MIIPSSHLVKLCLFVKYMLICDCCLLIIIMFSLVPDNVLKILYTNKYMYSPYNVIHGIKESKLYTLKNII